MTFEQELDTLKTTLEQTYNQKPEDARTAVKPTRELHQPAEAATGQGKSQGQTWKESWPN